jgi:hypothetical protein
VVESRDATVAGNVEKGRITHVLGIMLRHAAENARKHLFEMSQKLGGSFERRGLKLFKRRAGKLFVSRVKPRAIDPGTVFSERLSRIVEVLKSSPGMMLHDLVEAIEPSPAPAEALTAPEEGTAPAQPPKQAPTEQQISVIKDIRWLANEGYVIEYSDGMVFLGVQGEPQTATKSSPTSQPPTEADSAPVSPEQAEEQAAPASTAAEVETLTEPHQGESESVESLDAAANSKSESEPTSPPAQE